MSKNRYKNTDIWYMSYGIVPLVNNQSVLFLAKRSTMEAFNAGFWIL